MAILKPVNLSPNNIAVDATQQIIFSWKQLGDRQTAYQLLIYKNEDNTLVYDSTKVISYNQFHVLPANTIVNGVQYKYIVKNYNANDEVAISDYTLFKTSSIPIVSLTNISEGGTILNSSYTFQGLYSQAEDVPIKSWQMILYDTSDTIIAHTSEIFSSTIEHEFAGLKNNRIYKIELQVKSQDNLLATTGKISFNISYIVPTSTIALKAENHYETGGIKLSWNVAQIIGKGENYSFGDNQIDVRNGRVYFDEGFNIEGKFTAEAWLEGITNHIFAIAHDLQCIHSNNNGFWDDNGIWNDLGYWNDGWEENVLWIDDPNQSIEKELTPILSSVAPSYDNYLWIDRTNLIVPIFLSVEQNIETPTVLNSLWVDLESIDVSGNTDINIIKFSNGQDTIYVKYFNSAFHLFVNDLEINSVSIEASKYYVYIQQLDDSYVLHAEACA